MTEHGSGASPVERLQDLLLESTDITDFLDEFTRMLAGSLSTGGDEVWCAVTLLRERKAATVASSSERAEQLDEIQYGFGDGPCLTAAREHRLVHVRDMKLEDRWPGYKEAAARNGIRSVLGVPMELGEEASAGINLYSDQPDKYDDAAIEAIQHEVLLASKALRLAVRLARHREAEADLAAAMRSRTAIDLAVGIVMGQNRCSQEQAVEILKAASSHRNVKLRDLAAELVASVSKGRVETHFDV
ncbi:RNA-binding protein [Kocuria dechangensis]|uniref:RNA-binding protein n=1 Tax=Kocuria dechangensis TaxID=1176249 RepID=A0A917GNS0_9MICC|nr:GAF and ANTAR domain-containing protein [Kocuria dechangensis]GGG52029.1 RNA-binding protein [Kocuria dechangensis]